MRQPNHYGYYIFLGLGDFPDRFPRDPEWTRTWDEDAWLRFIDELADMGCNTLLVYLMGHRLPYASEAFPECVETGNPNVQRDFFQNVLDRARDAGMETVAVFTSTGHAQGFAGMRPELAIRDRDGAPHPEHGIVCHHREQAQQYPLTVVRECLGRYGGFSGVVVHPPEFGMPCYCDACRGVFRRQTGGELRDAPDKQAQGFFMESNLAWQRRCLEPEIRARLPQARFLTFTVPWVFEQHFEEFAPHIDRDTAIVDWDYELQPERMAQIPARMTRYRQFGHDVWFMPTSGYNFDRREPMEPQAERVLEQIDIALGAGITDVVYFMGPVRWPGFKATSWRLNRQA